MIIVLDGYDASGKTSIAKSIASQLGLNYVKPFEGILGPNLIALSENKQYDKIVSIYNSLDIPDNSVIDRHWMTIMSVLPENHWDRIAFQLSWKTLNHSSFYVYANEQVTQERIETRGEVFSLEEYNLYTKIHTLIYHRYWRSISSIDTSRLCLDATVRLILSHARPQLSGIMR